MTEALAAGTRDAFTALLTADVHWGGEHGGHECSTRDQAGDHYAGLLAAGATLHLVDLQPAGPTGDAEQVLARLHLESADPGDFPPQLSVRLTLRGRLIADILELDPPPTIEVLYFDGCPNHDTFLPHLKALLAEHHIDAAVTLIRIDDDQAAQEHRFLGSPTVRVDGRDVEPGAAERYHQDERHGQDPQTASSPYGLQCRLYPTPSGSLTGVPRDEWILDALVDNPTHEAAIAAVRAGDLPTLHQLLKERPDLARLRLPRHQGRTLLHIATDWPGHYPNVAATIGALIAAGADPNTPSLGEHPETPLHWAASSDDLAAIDALLDNGADINIRGAEIGAGTPMADATAFGQWGAARRLLERGADTDLFDAGALGLVTEVRRRLKADHPTADRVTSSFWGACHGGQIATAAVLLERGADINWVGYDRLTPLDAARRSGADAVVAWLELRGATEAEQPPDPRQSASQSR